MPVTVLRISFQPGDLGRAQRLLVPARTDRPRPLALLLVRGAPSTRKVRRAPVYPTADRRSADAYGGHRPHPGSRHRHRLERAAHGHDAPGASHEARGEPNANRRGARNNRRPGPSSRSRHEILVGAHVPSLAATKAGASSGGSGWSSASTFETATPPPAPTLERDKSESAHSRPPQEF